jgi:hypothetical protein
MGIEGKSAREIFNQIKGYYEQWKKNGPGIRQILGNEEFKYNVIKECFEKHNIILDL